jgi:hypothetical protein
MICSTVCTAGMAAGSGNHTGTQVVEEGAGAEREGRVTVDKVPVVGITMTTITVVTTTQHQSCRHRT